MNGERSYLPRSRDESYSHSRTTEEQLQWFIVSRVHAYKDRGDRDGETGREGKTPWIWEWKSLCPAFVVERERERDEVASDKWARETTVEAECISLKHTCTRNHMSVTVDEKKFIAGNSAVSLATRKYFITVDSVVHVNARRLAEREKKWPSERKKKTACYPFFLLFRPQLFPHHQLFKRDTQTPQRRRGEGEKSGHFTHAAVSSLFGEMILTWGLCSV